MGFGLLFIGYLFAFGFTSGANYIVSLVGLVGSVFMFIASNKLAQYEKTFIYTKFTSILLGASYIFNTVIQLSEQADIVQSGSFLSKIARIFIISSVFAFNLFMYKGIYRIARFVGDRKLYNAAVKDFIIMVAYYLTMSLRFVSAYISLMATILAVAWLVLSVWLTMNAYMRICLPGDEDMSEKKISKK